MSETKRVAVVTGANRGLGWETCHQLAKQGIEVILTSRDEEKGKAAAETLQAEELELARQRANKRIFPRSPTAGLVNFRVQGSVFFY